MGAVAEEIPQALSAAGECVDEAAGWQLNDHRHVVAMSEVECGIKYLGSLTRRHSGSKCRNKELSVFVDSIKTNRVQSWLNVAINKEITKKLRVW